MTYKANEYTPVFNTPVKGGLEKKIVQKIMDLLNNEAYTYNSLDEFIEKNKDYQTFLKNAEMDTVVKHFERSINENDFKIILENFKKLEKDKKAFDKEAINTTKLGDNKEYNSVQIKGEDKTIFLDNSNSNQSIESQIEDIKKENAVAQTNDSTKNTEEAFKKLEEEKKESLNLKYLNELNPINLSEEENKIRSVAVQYQIETGEIVRVDLEKNLIVNSNDEIMKIEKRGDDYVIVDGKKNEKEAQPKETTMTQRQFVKTMPQNNGFAA